MTKEKHSVFIDPYSDFGFKKLFGDGSSPGVLIDFLDAVLKLERPIVSIEYIATEQLGDLPGHRKSFFDIYCIDVDENHFIIEVQQLKETYYPDRALFYSTFPVRRQSKKGEWDFQLNRTYTICILNFCFEDTDPNEMWHEVKLIDTKTKQVFTDNLVFVYLEMPKFKKEDHGLVTREDHWFWVLNNMTNMSSIPLSLQHDPIFKQFFMDAQLANLREEELMAYYASRKDEWDRYAIKTTARRDGVAEGLERGILITATNMLKKGINIQTIHECTGLSPDQIKALEKNIH